jgi:hypothetical protein
MYDTFSGGLIFIIVLGTISYLLDVMNAKEKYEKCIRNKFVQTFHWCHHVLNIYCLTGWLFYSPIFLIPFLIFPYVLVMQWTMNDSKCVGTQYVYNQCQIPEYEPLRDIIKFTGLKDWEHFPLIHRCSVILFSCIASYKLMHIM